MPQMESLRRAFHSEAKLQSKTLHRKVHPGDEDVPEKVGRWLCDEGTYCFLLKKMPGLTIKKGHTESTSRLLASPTLA